MTQMGFINISSAMYPKMLRDLKDPPKTLFYKGNLEILSNPCLSIIGTRNMTSYGQAVLNSFFIDFKHSEITIISGFMYGVDYYAHVKSLSMNLKTVAVLPCGINYIYPHQHASLYKDILLNDGLILSEYPDLNPPEKWTFVKRNRIVAALSHATLLVEASLHSGSLITANNANVLNRPVLCIPGNIFSKESEGTNLLLSSFGRVVTFGIDVLKYIK